MARPKTGAKDNLKPGQVITLVDLAACSGIHRNTIQGWTSRPDWPFPAGGPWNIWDVCQWRERNVEKTNVKRDDTDTEELKRRKFVSEVHEQEHEEEIANTKKKIDELKLRERRGELVERDAVSGWVRNAFHRLRQRIEAIPEEIGASIPPEFRSDVISDLKHKIRLALRELVDWNPDD